MSLAGPPHAALRAAASAATNRDAACSHPIQEEKYVHKPTRILKNIKNLQESLESQIPSKLQSRFATDLHVSQTIRQPFAFGCPEKPRTRLITCDKKVKRSAFVASPELHTDNDNTVY